MFLPALFLAIAIVNGAVALTSSSDREFHFKYSTDVLGLFRQEKDLGSSPDPADYATSNLGLINRLYPTDSATEEVSSKTQWPRFKKFVASLPQHSEYKILYIARHGEGYHNVAKAYYGTECWNCYWSRQPGNGTISWTDALLTPKGHEQTLKANKFWKDTAGIPLPEKFYTSPMQRCLDTVNITFGDFPAKNGFSPVVKETLREIINPCTCARRATSTSIKSSFPNFTLETTFPPLDTAWKKDFTEPYAAQKLRVSQFLDDVWADDENTFISVTTHGELVVPLLEAVGFPNPKFKLGTGQVIPVLVRGVRVKGGREAGGKEVEMVESKACGVCEAKPDV